MPKLWIFSDLHLESVPYPDAFEPSRPDFDILVAAGDIWEGDTLRGFRKLREFAGEKPIVFVMGNHEHWNGEISENLQMARLLAAEYQITPLDNEAAEIDGVRFVGGTLWSDYGLGGSLPDPRAETAEQIDVAHDGGTHLITVGDAIDLHRNSLTKLETLISEHAGDMPLVVVTHHAPHPDCLTPSMHGTWKAGNSASDLSHLTDSGKVDLWVHGHIHASIDMERPGGTRILCNPAGPRFANVSFDEGLIIDVD
jgi:Icc-related predicted phosphoesterase